MAQLLKSFILGGFECATHIRRDGRQVDVLADTHHDLHAREDYELLSSCGVKCVRDGLRWHLIERSPGVFDWSSFLPLLEASLDAGMQVIWDLCHWGVPQDIDLFSDTFVSRFEAFAREVATLIANRSNAVPFYCPINEISFWAWVGGDEAHFGPHQSARGPELKRQLVKASLAAIRAIREVDSRARFVQAEPVIQISANPLIPEGDADAKRHTDSQYEAWDQMRGDGLHENDGSLGGSADALDIIGVNYYWNNQWIHLGERTPPGHYLHVPLHILLQRVWERYGRPIIVTETGSEDPDGVGWLGYVAAEVRQALRAGVPVEGICLYPVMDYPGWDDDRHCSCGLIGLNAEWDTRHLRMDLAEEVRLQLGFERVVSKALAAAQSVAVAQPDASRAFRSTVTREIEERA